MVTSGFSRISGPARYGLRGMRGATAAEEKALLELGVDAVVLQKFRACGEWFKIPNQVRATNPNIASIQPLDDGGKLLTLQRKDATGLNYKVRIDRDGFPDFRPHLYDGDEGLAQVRIALTGDRGRDELAANLAAGFRNGTPDLYTWHHHQDLGVMQLVRSSVHDDVRHSGATAIFRALGGKGYARKARN